MTNWIVGDIHGCASELAALVEQLQLGPGDRLISCGDLFHRGPAPAEVMDLLAGIGALFILGNHERVVLDRMGLAPRCADSSDRPAHRDVFPPLTGGDLRGEGGLPCEVPPERREDVVRFLQRHSGYFIEGESLGTGQRTKDGRGWCVVHAGIGTARSLGEMSVGSLTNTRRVAGRGRPWWYELYTGPNLVMFGHTSSDRPRTRVVGGHLVALGLDTGCVFGGRLTAYSPDLDEFVSVAAARAYFAA